jgi:hypothetical protein
MYLHPDYPQLSGAFSAVQSPPGLGCGCGCGSGCGCGLGADAQGNPPTMVDNLITALTSTIQFGSGSIPVWVLVAVGLFAAGSFLSGGSGGMRVSRGR